MRIVWCSERGGFDETRVGDWMGGMMGLVMSGFDGR